ncbi:MAG: hypothetical protein VW687_01925 [Curvibacter sp.]
MLPARSKRYASDDGDIPRERLTSGWQLLLVLLVVLTLFYVVFPKRVLMQRLYDDTVLDALALSYLQNIFRADTRNTDAALLLARHHADTLDPRELEALVAPHTRSSDGRQRELAHALLIHALQRQLLADRDPGARAELRGRLEALLGSLLEARLPATLAHAYAALAYRLNLGELAMRLLRPFLADASPEALERYGHDAQARGEHVLASHYFLLARERSTQLEDMRRRFQLGLNALVAAGQAPQALEQAEHHLGALESDLPTLRYLTRLALAAGQPVVAARYARRLVFRPDTARSTP